MTIKKIEAMHKMYGVVPEKKCGDCCNLLVNQYSRRYFKCAVYGDSCSESTDWAKKWIACGMFNIEVKPDNHRALSIKQEDNTPMEGQIEMEV